MKNDVVISNFTGNVFRRATLPPVRKSAESNSDWLRGIDLDERDRGASLTTPYAQAAWVYCAISILAQSVAQIPFRISRIKGGNAKKVRALKNSSSAANRKLCRRALDEDIVTSGDVVDLFEHPHPTMNRQLFWEMVVTWNALRGEFFILPLDAGDTPVDLSERKPKVKRMITLPPELFWHVVMGFTLEGWRYSGSPLITPIPSEFLLPSEVIHSRQPNPYLYWRGMSPLLVLDGAAKTDFAGEQFQKGLWLNNADTGVVVTTEQLLGDDQRRAIESALRERKRKAGTPDRPLFLFGGAKIEKPTLSMMDMQFLETRKFLRREIFAILKVPDVMAGFTEDLNDGGAGGSLDAQKSSFIESTVGSLCGNIENSVQPIISTFDPDLVGWFDIDSLPIMQAARRARWDTAGKMFGMGVPINDVNTNLDLGLPEYAWGKKSFLPFNLQEVTKDGLGANEPLPSEETPKPEDEDDGSSSTDKSNPFGRMGKLLAALRTPAQPAAPGAEIKSKTANLWRKRMAFRKAHVNLFTGKIGKVLMTFRKKTLAKLDEIHLEKDAGRLSWEARSLVDLIFNAHDFGASLNGELQLPITALLQAAGENMMAEIGNDDPWKYPPKAVLEYLAGRKQKIQDCGQTVRDRLNTTLSEGVTNGETHLQLAARVKAEFTDLADGQAKVIARTEVNTATCKAGFDALVDAGIEYKSWLGSHGPHARAGHQAVEDATVDAPIPVTDCFDVEDEAGNVDQMMQPLDDENGARAGNIINCQCDVVAAQKVSEDEKSVTFKIFGVGQMKFLKK